MIVLMGESASGKSTIENELVKLGYDKIISYTTRPGRSSENDGKDYHFLTEEAFEYNKQDGFFAEHVTYRGWHYGIAKDDCTNDAVVVVEPSGLRQLKKMKNLNITSFYLKCTERERLIRMAKRGDEIMEIVKRIFSDQGVFQGIESEVTHIIDSNRKIQEILFDITNTLENK